MTALENPTFRVSISVHFRAAVHQDLPKMEWYGQYAHYRNLIRRAYREQQIGKRLILVADSNNFPIGNIFILFLNPENTPKTEKRAYLYSLRVMEMFRGCGIGTQLIQEAENLMANRHYRWSPLPLPKPIMAHNASMNVWDMKFLAKTPATGAILTMKDGPDRFKNPAGSCKKN